MLAGLCCTPTSRMSSRSPPPPSLSLYRERVCVCVCECVIRMIPKAAKVRTGTATENILLMMVRDEMAKNAASPTKKLPITADSTTWRTSQLGEVSDCFELPGTNPLHPQHSCTSFSPEQCHPSGLLETKTAQQHPKSSDPAATHQLHCLRIVLNWLLLLRKVNLQTRSAKPSDSACKADETLSTVE